MKKLFYFLLFCCVSTLWMNAQETKSIIAELNADYPGKGRVTIYEDEAVKGIVGRPITPQLPVYTEPGGVSYIKMRGYKIQAFAGNDQRTSKNEAYSKQALINQAFPELETVIIFDSPFWRLRVGNFKTREEAEKVLDEMRLAFPSFGKEMYIVPDEVKIPIEQPADY
ncbi:MAG: SPOR domain-containing protein [Dysgonamonadaceae bacterium]|jgi:hypothetical protein